MLNIGISLFRMILQVKNSPDLITAKRLYCNALDMIFLHTFGASGP
ncbi:hypothetical protein HXT23_06065 [Gardnerella sp. DNF00257]